MASPRRVLLEFPIDDVEIRKQAPQKRIIDDKFGSELRNPDAIDAKVRAALNAYSAEYCVVRRRYHALTTGQLWSDLRAPEERAALAAGLHKQEYEVMVGYLIIEWQD